MLKTVFIEGLPGSGKSTTATDLGRYIISNGESVKVILEPDEVNPFRLDAGTSQDVQPSFFIQQISKQWMDFLSQNSVVNCYLVQEAMTIQQQVNYLLWMNKKEEITPLVLKLFDISKDLNPSLIYLYQKDAISSFQNIMLSRGQNWVEQKVKPIVNSPFANGKDKEHIALMRSFICEAQAITDSLFDLFPYKKLKINTSGQRENRAQEIYNFIS